MRHRFLSKTGIAVDDLVQRAIAENRQPQQGKGERDNQRAHHELANGAPARNSRQEQADKRRPRNPPRPEEQRPVIHPLYRTVEGEAIERHPHKAVHVVAHVEHQRVEQERGVPHKQHEQDQAQRQRDVQLGEHADALVHAGGHRDGGDNHGERNQRRFRRH